MNQQPNPVESKKKEYSSPKLVSISLRPEEAVLGHCKSSTAGGPGTSNCAVLFCSSLGS